MIRIALEQLRLLDQPLSKLISLVQTARFRHPLRLSIRWSRLRKNSRQNDLQTKRKGLAVWTVWVAVIFLDYS
ncbi:hypothetical protein C1X64_02970 [Pseudomonas sp. GW456-E7]|nr:hypothetical protein C1X64_02970 [Pseudomonas sp. GW456-E7]